MICRTDGAQPSVSFSPLAVLAFRFAIPLSLPLMTLRLYYADSYLRSFTARVVETADNGRRVYLDRTAFYPTSGGQPNDWGTLAGSAVVDVIDEDKGIAHLVDRPMANGGDVTGEIDWRRRFDHMQQHTGQHLLSAICHDTFNWPTLSVHFGDVISSIDIDTGAATPAQLLEIERRANEAITQDLTVTVTMEDAATVAGLRKASDRTGELRVVTIDGVDRSACGGTHVRRTGEIGSLLLGKAERTKQKLRIEFVCGARAVRRARADNAALSAIARHFSAPAAEVPALVEKLMVEHKNERALRQRLTADLARAEAATLWAAAPARADGLRLISVERHDLETVRALAQAVTERERVFFVGVATEVRTVLVATSADSGRDAGALLKPILATHGGRGGGSARLAQGLAEATALPAIMNALLNSALE